MKTRKALFMSTMLTLATLFFFSCEDEKGGDITPNPDDNLKGEYTEDVTLEKGKTYNLNGSMVMMAGELTIEEGVTIIAKGNTTSYIAVAKGAKIYVKGTAAAPVVMTSDVKEPGAWGGLVICGDAPVNTGDGGLSEVGNLPYGGTNKEDNSGSIEYLRVEYTGYVFTNEKQFNGVSFFGVGSGTKVEYVSSYKGNDDGIEFFGGAVSGKYLVSIESNDDGIDFADGWEGTGEYWYVLNSAKSGIEGSNNGDNGAATPMTNATVKNVSIIGMGEKPWFLKEGAGSQTIDNVVIGGLTNPDKAPYFFIETGDDDAIARAQAGDITITNVNFYGIGDVAKADDALTLTENENATGAGNGADMPEWAEGWSTPGDAVENIAGEYSSDLTLEAGKVYALNGSLVMNSGTLFIPEGVTIIAQGNTTSYIAIAQGAKIDVKGTATAPVVMTSSVQEPGSWGGLVICGKAPVNTGDGGLSEVGNLPYGGTESGDNSGSIEYLRVEYTGYIFTNEKQFNGVSFFGVGSGTKVEYVSSYKGNDDGIEFFGGAVSGKYLVSIESNDDGIDYADGWAGTGEYWYVLNSAKSGIEGSNNGDNGAATPMTTATVKNATIIGMGEKPWFLKEGAGSQTIDNVVIGGLTNEAKAPYFFIESGDDDAVARATAGDITITNVLFYNIGEVAKADASVTFTESATATGAGNGADAPDWAAGWSTPE